jgi:hypothetical protein
MAASDNHISAHKTKSLSIIFSPQKPHILAVVSFCTTRIIFKAQVLRHFFPHCGGPNSSGFYGGRSGLTFLSQYFVLPQTVDVISVPCTRISLQLRCVIAWNSQHDFTTSVPSSVFDLTWEDIKSGFQILHFLLVLCNLNVVFNSLYSHRYYFNSLSVSCYVINNYVVIPFIPISSSGKATK